MTPKLVAMTRASKKHVRVQTLSYVAYDDDLYVTKNITVQ
jgi:hypothetical protein